MQGGVQDHGGYITTVSTVVLAGVFVNTVSPKLEFPKKVWGPTL